MRDAADNADRIEGGGAVEGPRGAGAAELLCDAAQTALRDEAVHNGAAERTLLGKAHRYLKNTRSGASRGRRGTPGVPPREQLDQERLATVAKVEARPEGSDDAALQQLEKRLSRETAQFGRRKVAERRNVRAGVGRWR